MKRKIKLILAILTLSVMVVTTACNNNSSKKATHEHHQKAEYTCSMHPEVVKDAPGECPKCGMKLIEKKEHDHDGDHDHDHE